MITETPSLRLRDIKIGETVIITGFTAPMILMDKREGYGYLWRSKRDWIDGKMYATMASLGHEVKYAV